jgi:hypothetical protein
LQKICFWAAAIYVIGFSSLMYGKRADVIGLSLVALAILSRRRLSGKAFVKALMVSLVTIGVGIFIGAIRTEGIHGEGIKNILFFKTETTGGGFYIPNVTESYSSLCIVISYREFDAGQLWLGRSYYNCITTLLPSIINPYRAKESATTYLQANYQFFPGGMNFLGELWINFGKWGALLSAPVIAWLLNRLARWFWYSGRQEQVAFAFAVMAAFPRWLLYGTSCFTKTLLILGIYAVQIHIVMSLQPGTRRKRSMSG